MEQPPPRGWDAHAVACATEDVVVAVCTYNPLAVPVTLGRVALRVEAVGCEAEALGEPLTNVTLAPRERRRLELRIKCAHRGHVRVRGVLYTLSRGEEEFAASYDAPCVTV